MSTKGRAHPGHLWDLRYETIRRIHTSGAKLVVSSDQGSTGTQIGELALLMEFLCNQVQLPSSDVLYGATGLAAEALGLEDCIGTLRPGMLADIIVVAGDPLADMAAMQRIHMVIKDGEIRVRDGALL